MVCVREQKKSFTLVVLCQVFFVLVSATALVLADGEEPFVGVIKKIAADSNIVEVLRDNPAGRTAGEKITVLIREDPRIIDKSRNLIGFERLSVGSVVRIKPITRPNKDVEADIIQIVGGG